VVDNIRSNLLEARKSETNLQIKVDKYDQDNTDLEKKLSKARTKLATAQWRSYAEKKQWQGKISGLEKDLSRAKFRRRMYRRWLQREQLRRQMYAYQLRHTKTELQRKMQDATKQKKLATARILQLNVALGKLRHTSHSASKELDEVKRLVKKLTDANTKAQSTISEVHDENEKLKATNNTLAAENKKLTDKLATCSTKVTPPVVMGPR
jgi:chromosome segregation ATPase